MTLARRWATTGYYPLLFACSCPVKTMRSAVWLVQAFLLIVLTFAVTPAIAQDQIGKAQELYAAASYEEALALLDQMQTGAAGGSPADKRQIAYYRALCLLALGRSDEADRALEVAALADPFYRLKDAEASPSVRARAEAARQRAIPAIAGGCTTRSRTVSAGATGRTSCSGRPRSTRSSTIRRSANGPAASSLADLRTLNAGFLEVSRKSLETAPLPTTALGNNPAPAAGRYRAGCAPVSSPAPPPAAPAVRQPPRRSSGVDSTSHRRRPTRPEPPTPPPATRTETPRPTTAGCRTTPAARDRVAAGEQPGPTRPRQAGDDSSDHPASPPPSEPAAPASTSAPPPRPVRRPGHPPAVDLATRERAGFASRKQPPATTSRTGRNRLAPTRGDAAPARVLVPPSVISQLIPAWPGGITLPRDRPFRGTVRVTIDEQGRVESAVMMRPIHPVYDPLLMDAARSWKSRPGETRNRGEVRQGRRSDAGSARERLSGSSGRPFPAAIRKRRARRSPAAARGPTTVGSLEAPAGERLSAPAPPTRAQRSATGTQG